ncbi:D-aminoacyl-tRNA deacylase [Anaerovorax odorimutans]|uniref:D-aminoacyl-tRNA deacylase n=1 Tax=Anaerovorax odorimutans TaxID=109327 RepID=UPI0003F500D7|nr:D-aminoacyl-tRNA deacylase [Anaerovorax odorimutans]
MRAVVQRVINADVTVEGNITGAIKKGLVVLVGVEENDDIVDVSYIVDKVTGLRIFEDENEKMNLSVQDVKGDILAVSQFTLFGDCRKGKRPSFIKAAKPDKANKLYIEFVNQCRKKNIKVEEGIFQADMLVKIYNDGPVTVLLDSKKTF